MIIGPVIPYTVFAPKQHILNTLKQVSKYFPKIQCNHLQNSFSIHKTTTSRIDVYVNQDINTSCPKFSKIHKFLKKKINNFPDLTNMNDGFKLYKIQP